MNYTLFKRAALYRDSIAIVDVASRFVCEDTRAAALECKCGRDHINDASLVARRDPTHTLDLRKRFIRDLEGRWRKVARLVTEALATQDMFGLKATNARAFQIIAYSSGRIPAFQAWLDAVLADTILGLSREQWVGNYIRAAYSRGFNVAESQVKRSVPIHLDRADIITKLTITELQGVIEAVSQIAVRAFSDGLLSHLPPATIARTIRQRIDRIGIVRSRATVQTMVVRANGEAALDCFQLAGIKTVGVLPETIPSPGRQHAIRDAARKKRRVKNLVNVLTAGDDDVCPLCEDIAAGNPYTIADARGLIPAHPNCRCAFVPLDDARFAQGDARPIFFDWDPSQPRNPDGTWGEGEVIEMAKTQRELLQRIRMQRSAEQKGEAWAGLPGEHATFKPGQHAGAHHDSVDVAYRSVTGGNLYIGQKLKDRDEVTLTRSLVKDGGQIWEVDVSGIHVEFDDNAVYIPPETVFELTAFDAARSVWLVKAW